MRHKPFRMPPRLVLMKCTILSFHGSFDGWSNTRFFRVASSFFRYRLILDDGVRDGVSLSAQAEHEGLYRVREDIVDDDRADLDGCLLETLAESLADGLVLSTIEVLTVVLVAAVEGSSSSSSVGVPSSWIVIEGFGLIQSEGNSIEPGR